MGGKGKGKGKGLLPDYFGLLQFSSLISDYFKLCQAISDYYNFFRTLFHTSSHDFGLFQFVSDCFGPVRTISNYF